MQARAWLAFVASTFACTTFGTADDRADAAVMGDGSPAVADAAVDASQVVDASEVKDGDGSSSQCPPEAVFCQNFETPTLTSPFGFDRVTGNEAKIVLDKDGKNRFLEVRFSNPPSTYLRKVLEENAEYDLSYRFRWAEMNCEYVTLGGYFFTAGRNDPGGAIVGPTLCSDGMSMGGSNSECDGMRRLGRDTWQETRIRASKGTPNRTATLKIVGTNDFPPIVQSLPILSLTLGIQYTSTKCTNVVVNYDDVVVRKL